MQTSITQFHNKVANGTYQGQGYPEIHSMASESATVAVGQAMIRGTDPETQAILPSALFSADLAFIGFSVLPNTREKLLTDMTGDVTWSQYENVPLANKGMWGIACESAFTAGLVCQVVCISAGSVAGQTVGNLTATVDAVNAQPINAVFETSGSAGEVAVIRFF